MPVVIAVLVILVIYFGVNYPQVTFPALIIGAVLFFFWFRNFQKKAGEARFRVLEKKNAENERMDEAYSMANSKANIPSNAKKVVYKRGYASMLQAAQYIWIEGNNLCFFPVKPPTDTIRLLPEKLIFKNKIPIEKIEYYSSKGEIIHETKISGGGGGGSSIGGAVVGDLIAGPVGAVIGSRNKINPIESQLITHDNRVTFLNYFDENNEKHSMFFEHDAINLFNDLLPEKAYEIVNAIKTNRILNKVKTDSEPTNAANQIRELGKLKDEGLLTEEEFQNKKKELLEKIK